MAASQEQKVDFLLKKIGYVASKTGIAEDESSLSGTKKAPFGEAIPSPLVVPSTSVWADSSFIPSTPPGASTAYVEVYLSGTSGHRMTADSTISGNRTFIAHSTYNNSSSAILGDWIDTSFSADYIIKVYKGDPNSGGVQLSAAGSGSNDTWFFDYSSGVLNFNGTQVPSGVTSSNIYIVGYRYIGTKGIQFPAGVTTATSLSVSGITTFTGLVDANGGVTANTLIVEDLTDNRVIIAGSGGELEDDANLTFNGSTLSVGVNLDVDGRTELDTTNISETLSVAGISTFTGNIDANGDLDVDGRTELDITNISETLNVTGIATFAADVDLNAGLDVDGRTELDVTNISETLNVVGVSTFQSNVHLGDNDKINLGDDDDLQIYHTGTTGNIHNDTGTLILQSSNVRIQDAGSSQTAFSAADGVAKLYLANSEKLETTSYGTHTTGIASATTLSTGAVGTGINIGVSSITGPAEILIDPAGVGDNTGTVRIAGDLQVDGTTVTLDTTVTEVDKLEVAANNTTVGVAITQSGSGDILNLYDGSTEVFSVEDGGRIVATATNSVIPFLYSTYADLPSPSTYHGAFAHVHATGRAYYAHAGNWMEIVNKEVNGVVGTGTETYNVGAATFSGDVSIADKIIHTGDTNTAIRFPAADTFTVETSGSERFRVDSTGRVGIATANPGQKLTVYNESANANGGILVQNVTYASNEDKPYLTVGTKGWTGATTNWNTFGFQHRIKSSSGGTPRITVDSTSGELFSITSSGNIGIGTDNPALRAHIFSTANADSALIESTQNFATLRFKSATNTSGPTVGIDGGGGLQLDQKDTSKYIAFSIGSERLRILNDGKVRVPDNGKFVAGAGDDLQIYHNGTNNYIDANGDFFLRVNNGTETALYATANGATQLNYDNAKKLETKSDGIDVSGEVQCDSLDVDGVVDITGEVTLHANLDLQDDDKIMLGTGDDLQIYHDGSNSYISDAGTGGLNIQGSTVTIEHTGGNHAIVADGNGATNIYYQGSEKLATKSFGVDVTGEVQCDSLDVDGVVDITGEVTLHANLDLQDNDKILLGTGDDLQIYHNGTDSYINNASGSFFIRTEVDNADIVIQSDNGSGGVAQYFRADGSSGQAIMYHYGSSKLNTVAAGINVTGNTETDTLTTGNTILTGTVSAGSSTGNDGQYLISTGVGVSWTTLPTARTTTTIIASEDQTSFPFNYNVGFLDVFYNGVKLADTEFTASNGTSVVLGDVAYAGDVVELISYATATSGGGGGGASNLNDLADVTITGSPVIGETLTHNGTKFVNDYTATTTTTATTQVSILSLDLSVYRSAEYQIQVTEGSKYHTTKILAIHNGTAASHNEFGTLSIGTVPATFDVDISGSNMRLLATPASSNSTVFKVKFTGIKV